MPDTTGGIGGCLRRAREHRGLTLQGIASRTKISVSALRAIERNRFEDLPGGVFRRAYVRTFAAEVGLDAERLVRDYLDRFEPPAQDLQEPRVRARPDGRLRRIAGGALLLTAIVALLAWALTSGVSSSG